MATRQRLLITGAGGFIGHHLATAILRDSRYDGWQVTLVDSNAIAIRDRQARIIEGDLADRCVVDDAIGGGVDLVYHLASVVGGAAEADYALARKVNVDATLTLFERLHQTGLCPRVVYASSIAVFGEPPPPAVDDSTAPRPTLVYGAQKQMMEVALAQFSARGWLDGLSLRLPAIVAKPPAGPGTKPVFINAIFHAFAAGQDITIPVSPQGTLWLLSTQRCVEALIHAGLLSSVVIGRDRTLTLPAMRVTMQALVDALALFYPESRSRIEFAPNPTLEAQFASQPPLSTPAADRLGFRHDETLANLISGAIG